VDWLLGFCGVFVGGEFFCLFLVFFCLGFDGGVMGRGGIDCGVWVFVLCVFFLKVRVLCCVWFGVGGVWLWFGSVCFVLCDLDGEFFCCLFLFFYVCVWVVLVLFWFSVFLILFFYLR